MSINGSLKQLSHAPPLRGGVGDRYRLGHKPVRLLLDGALLQGFLQWP